MGRRPCVQGRRQDLHHPGRDVARRTRGLFKASEFSYILLVEQPGIRPAPYLARAKWVAAALGALPADDLQAYLREAHRLVLAKLTRAARAEILGPA